MEVKLMPNNPKPVLKSQKQQNSGKPETPLIKKQAPQKNSAEKQPLNIQSADAKAVPLMFQAQIEGRGNIQYVGEKKNEKTGQKSQEEPGYKQWVDQWLAARPPVKFTPTTPTSSSMADWQKALAKLATVETQKSMKSLDSPINQQWEYQVRWRLITNSGQDNFIRPVIGKEGMPFFPGSSMKGAFRNACSTSEERMRYCGGKEKNKKGEERTKPGILRFQGGYPIDDEWKRQRDRLVDIAHAQEKYQVQDGKASHNANVQISLYRTKFRFNISSAEPLSEQEWGEVKKIWEKALGYGLGSRISAGYGYMEDILSSRPSLYSIYLKGWGLSSLLLLPTASKTDEFRPNMFKAVLRGHTSRLLAGITDKATAQRLTHQLWGGIEGSAVEGCVGINFIPGKLISEEHKYKDKKVSMPIYTLEDGQLDLLYIKEMKPELEQFLLSLVKFSVLLGGFGKSWRRVHHKLFHRNYFKRGDKPMIGCHWEFANQSKDLYISANQDDLSEISDFLKQIRQQAIAWVQAEGLSCNDYITGWRETWHPDNVQVWGRIAPNGKSQAVEWFHDFNYLKGTELAGKMGQIGRIWHRMYPRHELKDGTFSRTDKDYVELLTIFPDTSPGSQKFMDFLATTASQFQKLDLDEDQQ
jgi:CRISPR-associated protein Cmr6